MTSPTYAQLLALAQASGIPLADRARYTLVGKFGNKGPRLYVAKPFRKGALAGDLPSPGIDVSGCALEGQLPLKSPNGAVTGHLDPSDAEGFALALKALASLGPAPKAPAKPKSAPAPQTPGELEAHAALVARVAAEMGVSVSA
jgi:hypothetical protein